MRIQNRGAAEVALLFVIRIGCGRIRRGGKQEEMEFRMYRTLPDGARMIRETVFHQEQGFQNEFDEVDLRARHGLLTEAGSPVGTFRLFAGEEPGVMILGRLAVLKPWRGRKAGSRLVREALAAARACGAGKLRLHAQVRAARFYETLGFTAYGPVEDDEGVPHQWMECELK